MKDLAAIEDRLRRTYRAVADTTVVAPAELPAGTQPTADLEIVDLGEVAHAGDGAITSPAKRRKRRRRPVLVAAAAVVALGIASAVVLRSDPDTARTAAPGPGWEQLPDAPIGARYGHSAMWTGEEMIVLGGYTGPEEAPRPASDAAAYNPATGRWRSIADPPPPGPEDTYVGVWTGEVVVAITTTYSQAEGVPDTTGGAIYDPATDRWRQIASTDLGALVLSGWVFWTGDRVLVVGFSSIDDPTPGLRSATYDPATDSWQSLPEPPLGIDGHTGTAVWTGTELVWVGPSPATAGTGSDRSAGCLPDCPAGAGSLIAMALDPATGDWRQLPAPELSSRTRPVVAWTGSELLVVGGWGIGDEEGALVDGASFDPETGRWTALPGAPVAPTGGSDGPATNVALAVGQLVVLDVADDAGTASSLVLDLVARTWRLGPPDPRGGTQSAVTSTGTELLVWGVVTDSREAVAEGWSYTP